MLFFYNAFLILYLTGIRIASIWNSKAKQWLEGRKNIFSRLQSAIYSDSSPIIWFHCASLGEFEQGRPVIEKIKAQDTRHKILLTFFSPSGYEVQKNYKGADYIFYLPMDSNKNAKEFIRIMKPSLIVFVKYDYWHYYLKTIKEKNIPLLLISALFRKEQPFFQWYGWFHRKMLTSFNHLFVQNEASKELLVKIGLDASSSVAGDTRFDRVIEIAEKFEPIPSIEKFIEDNKVVVAGSTWKDDEETLQKAFEQINDPFLKLIIAPHEINERHLAEIKILFPDSVFYSQLLAESCGQTTRRVLRTNHPQGPADKLPAGSCGQAIKHLIIDNIGLLSRLYHYGFITYIGGGFTKDGIHNVLEAAVYGKPVIFGPNYKKYPEAKDLIKCKGALSIKDHTELLNHIKSLLINEDNCFSLASEASLNYVRKNSGASSKIVAFVQKNRLLTS